MSKMPGRPAAPSVPSFEYSGLTDEEIKAARERARRKMADQIAEAELGYGPSKLEVRKGPPPNLQEEQFDLTLDLYPGCEQIVLDGTIYRHGQTVTVGKRVFDTLTEIIARGWGHQRVVDGKNENTYRAQQNVRARVGMADRLAGRPIQ